MGDCVVLPNTFPDWNLPALLVEFDSYSASMYISSSTFVVLINFDNEIKYSTAKKNTGIVLSLLNN